MNPWRPTWTLRFWPWSALQRAAALSFIDRGSEQEPIVNLCVPQSSPAPRTPNPESPRPRCSHFFIFMRPHWRAKLRTLRLDCLPVRIRQRRGYRRVMVPCSSSSFAAARPSYDVGMAKLVLLAHVRLHFERTLRIYLPV